MALFWLGPARPGPAWSSAPTEVGAVTSICFHLDGIPLALELAASRVGALSLGEIADRLTGCFELLARAVAGPARHQTLRASVEWSFQLLPAAERALFGQARGLRRRLVAAHGAEVSARALSDPGGPGGPVAGRAWWTSHWCRDQTGTGTRYRLLEAIRTFAHERLAESGELDEMRARHGAYFARLASTVAPVLLGPDQARWARRLDQENENLRAARLWCATVLARAGPGLRLASGLWEYWLIRGRLDEGTGWLDDALAQRAGPGGARAVALNWAGESTSHPARRPSAGSGSCSTQTIALYQQAGDRGGQAQALD